MKKTLLKNSKFLNPKIFKIQNLKNSDNNIPMKNYYQKVYNIKLDDSQPLLRLKASGNKKSDTGSFYPSELCYIRGVTEEMNEDKILMKNISNFTKMRPDQKVKLIEGILEAFNNTKCREKKGVKLTSAKERYDEYGLKLVSTTDRSYKGLSMVPPKMIIKDNSKDEIKLKTFK